jgi:putative membrane protein
MKRTTSTLLSIGVSAVLIAVGIWFLYDWDTKIWPENGRWFMGHHTIMGGGMGIAMILFWIILIFVFMLLISGVINGRLGTKQKEDDMPDTLEIIKARYARGEIDKAEYEEKLKDLGV